MTLFGVPISELLVGLVLGNMVVGVAVLFAHNLFDGCDD